jgi:carbon monoxide dehydrogenase subunit G
MMLIENSFQIAAPPDRVFEFLQDAHNVVACFPGAELTEDLGDDAYKGKVKIKVGPVTAAYSGIAKIVAKDPVTRVAVLRAEGKDSKGNGTAKANATMTVTADGEGSTVQLDTDLTISGKVAQFGRGIIADVSTRMVGELASRVRARIESDNPTPEAATPEASVPGATGSTAAAGPEAVVPETGASEAATTATVETAAVDSPTTPAAPSTSGDTATTTPNPTTTPAVAPTKAGPTKAAPAQDSADEVAPIKASTILWSVLAGMFRRLGTRIRAARHRSTGTTASTKDS